MKLKPNPKAANLVDRVCRLEEQAALHQDLSLLDYFAGQAMTGLISRSPRDDLLSDIADIAYRMADAMLEERAMDDK